MDTSNNDSCYFNFTEDWPGQGKPGPGWEVNHPSVSNFTDFGKGILIYLSTNNPATAFSSILFAFAGASTFPTIQADMKDRTQFPKAAVAAMFGEILPPSPSTVLFLIYMPMSVVGWALLGDLVAGSVVESLCDGPVSFILIVIPYKLLFQIKVAVEILFLIHLITAFPILINPPCQLFENILNIPLSKCYFKKFMKLCSFWMEANCLPQPCDCSPYCYWTLCSVLWCHC